LGQLQEIEPKLKEMGYQLIAISPDSPEQTHKTREKLKLSYLLLSDSSMAVSRAFGIAFVSKNGVRNKMSAKATEKFSGEKHHQLPVPSVFIIGTDGVIDFVHYNPDYTVRMPPEALLAECEKALEK
jgi:peroxiredoxin